MSLYGLSDADLVMLDLLEDNVTQYLFWDKVDERDPDECWPWFGRVDKDSYGKFSYKGKTLRAHRVALALDLDRMLNGFVLHSCDRRFCCNPHHLREGTHEENMDDRAERIEVEVLPES